MNKTTTLVTASLCTTALAWSASLLANDDYITLASTTSTENSGLFGAILPVFTEATGIDVRVVAVGTTAARALESAATSGQATGRTSLFITRGYEWKSVDLLVTNFHMPRTSLLLMIDSFIGDRWRRLYSEAVAEKYRFLSFGDAMLLDRHAKGSD